MNQKIVSYKTVYEGRQAEIVEKKSRFIATVFHVESEEEAEEYIEQLRKKYWDARHNCYAYVLGKNGEKMKCSDDGEPQQTAGKPMLDVLTGQKLCDTLVVVTRYFGGTLLGTGGLVRAYSKAVQEGLSASVLVEKQLAVMLEVCTDYNGLGKIQYILGQENLQPYNTEYAEDVRIHVPVPFSDLAQMKDKITQGTNGKAVMEELYELYFGKIGKELVLFEK